MKSHLPAQPNRSLMEGLEVLLALVQRGESVGVRELARQLDMTPSRLQRYVATLAHLGLARQRPDRRYEVGAGIHSLSAMSLTASGLAPRAFAVLPELDDLGLNVALGVLWRRTVSYLYFSRPGAPPAHALGTEPGWPARESSIGLLMLAHADPEQVERDFPEDASLLRPQLPNIRKEGMVKIARPTGDHSLAVTVGDPVTAGLAVSGRFTEAETPAIVARLREAASRLDTPSPETTP